MLRSPKKRASMAARVLRLPHTTETVDRLIAGAGHAQEALNERLGLREGWAHDHIPTKVFLPYYWQQVANKPDHVFYRTSEGLGILIACTVECDDCCWMKVTVSKHGGQVYPTLPEIFEVRAAIWGTDPDVILPLVPKHDVGKHLCVTMFRRLHDEPLCPDFTWGTGRL